MKFKPTHKPGAVVVELGPKDRELPSAVAATQTAFSLKKILVPLDFSDASRKALDYAIPLARQFSARITLLHIVEPYPPVPQMDPIDSTYLREATEKLRAVRTMGSDLQTEPLIRLGTAHTEIVRAARELGIDLIILSTHGLTGLAHMFLGSTAEKVVRHAGCPVLVVRENERDFVEPADRSTPTV